MQTQAAAAFIHREGTIRERIISDRMDRSRQHPQSPKQLYRSRMYRNLCLLMHRRIRLLSLALGDLLQFRGWSLIEELKEKQGLTWPQRGKARNRSDGCHDRSYSRNIFTPSQHLLSIPSSRRTLDASTRTPRLRCPMATGSRIGETSQLARQDRRTREPRA